jgi:3-methyladenine DNA glycosylase AlkD
MCNLVYEVRNQLEQLAEPKYQEFSSRLIPGTDNLIGVRLPKIRKIAKEIVKQGNWKEYLSSNPSLYFEETMLQGMIIGEVKKDIEIVLGLVKDFVPKIDNWSVCDSFCSSLKIIKLHRKHVWDFIAPYFSSLNAYDIRFGVVILIFYYIDEKYIDDVLNILDNVHHDDYYVKMAVAWAVSICFINIPNKTMNYLKNNSLDDDTYNKALRKICESLCVDKETKAIIRSMKRK